jgi:hypothetical protein
MRILPVSSAEDIASDIITLNKDGPLHVKTFTIHDSFECRNISDDNVHFL